MNVPPRLIDQTSWIVKNLHEQATSEKIWEISVPQRNNLEWSIIVSYIISIFGFSNDRRKIKFDLILGDIKEIQAMKKLTNIRRKPTWKKVRDQVYSFNPFQNKPPLYSDGTMRHLVQLFAERLNANGTPVTCDGEIFDNSIKLATISRLLKCCIKVYAEETKENREIIEHFSVEQNDNATIVLFQRPQTSKQYPGRRVKYSFGMNLCYANRLRRDSLSVILREAQLSSDMILNIVNYLNYNENFLLALLKNYWRESIPQIYSSPYIPQRLSYAGFNTNPYQIEQNGISTFFHCMGLDTNHPLYTLYYYVANCFYLYKHSIRCPSPEIANSVQRIGFRLKMDLKISNNFFKLDCGQTLAVKTYNNIFQLNRFQNTVINDIIEINKEYDLSKNFNVKKRIVISILKNYENLETFPIYFDEVPKAYIEFKDCFRNIDHYTCFLLFDNILCINPFNKPIFLRTIFNLFLTILSHEKFPNCEHGTFCNTCQLTGRSMALQCIPFSYRLEFKRNSRELLRNLMDDPVEDESEPDAILKIIIKELEKYPEIKDEFLFTRLSTYLAIASSVSFNSNKRKAILVIERALQVLGETLVTLEKNNVVGCLLKFNLPSGLGEVLLCLRNHCFSHYQASSSFGKRNLEKDALRFESLQPTLRNILEVVQQVYVMHVYRVEIFLIEKCSFSHLINYPLLIRDILLEKKRINDLQLEYFNSMKPQVKLSVKNAIKGLYRSIKEYKEVKDLKPEVLTLKVLVLFINQQSGGDDPKKLVEAVKRLSDFVKNNCGSCLNDMMKSELAAQIMNIRDITENLFRDTVSLDADYSNFDYSKLTQFLNDLKGYTYFSMQEIDTIKQKCLDQCKRIEEAKDSLRESLTKTSSLTLKEEERLLNGIPMSKNKRIFIKKALSRDREKALKILNNLSNMTQSLMNITDMNGFRTFIDIQDNRNLLLSTVLPCPLNKKILRFLNRKIEFLLHSMKQLKTILIEENEEIRTLFTSKNKDENARKHAIFLMRERYKKDPVVRLSLEMLLFECQNILNYRTDFKHLWEKLSGLFSGANLRDVLSHGSTVLQIADENLDGNDLPDNFIEKMLELVGDIEVLEALSFLWSKSKTENLKEFENEILQDNSKSSSAAVIKKNPMWRSYMQLLPLH